MRFLTIICLLFLVSCTHRSHLDELRSEVSQHEARNIDEIRMELKGILDHHPELAQQTKSEVSKRVEASLARHQELRDQESRVIQHVLKDAVSAEETGNSEIKTHRKELRSIYEQKSDNLFNLVREIKTITDAADERWQQEMEILYREFR